MVRQKPSLSFPELSCTNLAISSSVISSLIINFTKQLRICPFFFQGIGFGGGCRLRHLLSAALRFNSFRLGCLLLFLPPLRPASRRKLLMLLVALLIMPVLSQYSS